jgi:mono/diheme cytochrome c family protein
MEPHFTTGTHLIMNTLSKKVISVFLVASVFALPGCIDKGNGEIESPANAKYQLVNLEQGWSDNERLDFYNTSQGSQLIPYSWFLALEQFDNDQRFRNNDNIIRLGYIPQDSIAGVNPDGLPIGFVRDDDLEPFLSSTLSASRLSSNSDGYQSEYKEWLGLTCAACHTSEIDFNKHRLRIDGGPPLSDFQSFIENLSKALQATVEDDAKLTRFSKNVLAEGGYSDTEKQRLKSEVNKFTSWLNNYIEINYGNLSTRYGYGRLDAFGAILNRVTASFTGIQANARPANAPVSYPFLWNTSQHSWVQWNGSANNHIGRNVGEVSGVFAHTTVKTPDESERFSSSANIFNLDRLEQLMSRLDSPEWGLPLPSIDEEIATKGKALFARNCVICHGIRDDSGLFPMTDPNPFGARFIQIKMIALKSIGTDPMMAMNFVNPAYDVDPGVVRSFLPQAYKDKPKVPRAVMLSTVVGNVIGKQIAILQPPDPQEYLLQLSGFHLPEEKGGPAPPNIVAYKARPLNGIWATAPYLHNGSVSSLYQLLLPDTERNKSFYVGSKVFDAKNVGFESSQDGNSYLFNTVDDQGKPISGNGKHGHTGKYYTSTRAEDGQWRTYTDQERYQLVEYLKTL